MPSAAARQLYEDQIPSFMSIFDLNSDVMDHNGAVTIVDPKLMDLEPSCAPALTTQSQQLRAPTVPSDPSHKHNDSTSTQNSESANSSPTTTVSCTDSSSLSDPSPSSSPDSPINLLPMTSFPPNTFGALSSMATLTVAAEPPSLERPMTSPAPRRPKNMKGLSIQPPFAGSLSTSLSSEPASPAFIKPKIPGMKRKPSQLSLKTNSTDLVNRTILEVPKSPTVAPILQRRALKHSTSSPHMLSGLASATFGPVGGMTIPTVLERNESGLSKFLRPSKPIAAEFSHTPIKEEESPIRAQIANRAAFDFEPYHENENNEDQKSPGYPNGPIAIYGDNVYLYLEPTAEEASKFDVVINVAREVKNPFKALPNIEQPSKPTEILPRHFSTPDTSTNATSFAAPFDFIPEEASAETPTTPRAAQPFSEPEYIHMQWDHNTDISKDLMTLCETIDRKTNEGKRVLVHCQQGASRSASLIIAYGIFMNPDLSVNDAYDAAQKKSRWISPNMRLMYCLQDFQKDMSKRKSAPNSGFRPRAGRSPTKHRATLSADAIDIPAKEPLSAPLPAEDGHARSASPERSPLRSKSALSPNMGDPISPGPSSAPSSFSWSEIEDEKDRGRLGRYQLDSLTKSSQPGSASGSSPSFSRPPPSPGFAGFDFGFSTDSFPKPPPSPGFGFQISQLGQMGFQPTEEPSQPWGVAFGKTPAGLAPQGQVQPHSMQVERHITVPVAYPDDSALMSPRAETMTQNPLHQSFPEYAGMRFVEVPPTPSEGLFSPRETMFPRDPFFPFGRPSQVADPRSPPTKGETPIVRSIDELI